MDNLIVTLSLSHGFNKDGVPKRPLSSMNYARGFDAEKTTLAALMEHVAHGGAWAPATFQNGERNRNNVTGIQLLTAEYDAVKCEGDKESIDWQATEKAVPSTEQIIAMAKAGIIDAAYYSQSAQPGLGGVRLIKVLDQPLTDSSKYKGMSELQHRKIEEFTGKPITDRCGTDIARFWAGTNDPNKIICCLDSNTPLSLEAFMAEAEAEVISKDPYKYANNRVGQPAVAEPLSKAVISVIRYIFAEILPPPDGNSYQRVVSPAKALARLYSPLFDDDFCEWISTSEYRLRTIGGSPRHFLYSGQGFDCASVGWFIRTVDREVPTWRETFLETFGYKPGLNNFHPDNKLRSIANDF